jgi:branched-chain amino acid transport system substrate-binding protein
MKRSGTWPIFLLSLLAVALCFGVTSLEAQVKEQMFPLLCYRTGPYAPGGSGMCGGWEDYMAYLNTKGGVEGVTLRWEECETAYDTARGIECYERHKSRMIVVNPLSTGITYALIERAGRDKIPIVSLGYGRADASIGGEIFPYVFPLVTNYWSQTSAKIRFIAQKEGGEAQLKGKKIALLYLDVPYGRETIPILEKLAERFGFEFRGFAVPAPGLEQGAQWVDIARRFRADYVINRNWGVSCTVPLREAARVGFPREKIIGVWWCGSEEDVRPAGDAATGYVASNFHGVGADFPVLKGILDGVYGAGKGNLEKERVGTVYYNRGVVHGIVHTEALRTAIQRFGFPITGEQFKWALEHLDLTEARLQEIGAGGFMPPIKTAPDNHEGGGWVRFQQWDGKKWVSISDWVPPYKEIVWTEIETSAAAYAKEKDKK